MSFAACGPGFVSTDPLGAKGAAALHVGDFCSRFRKQRMAREIDDRAIARLWFSFGGPLGVCIPSIWTQKR